MVASELPQEILIDIFSRLPAKSLGQCKCLSKAWCDILSNPHFIRSQLNRKTHQQSLLLIAESQSIHSIATVKNGAVSRELNLPFFDCTEIEIVGSCDGLVFLVSEEDDDKFLVNPLTLEKVKIPNSPLALKDDKRDGYTMHGFGYDCSVDDYKIVMLSYYYSSDEDENEELDCEETFVDVYSVKRGVWRRVESCSPYNHAFHEPHFGAFLNGAIHWLARTRESSYRSLLVAFDLFDEVFTEIPTPGDMKREIFLFCQLVVLGGCLCVVDVRYSSQTNVWMMKEYGVVESWTKLSIDNCGKWGVRRPLCFVGDQEIALVVDGQTLGVYNLEKGTLRDMIVDEIPAVFYDGVKFVPSLVSPAYGRYPKFHHQRILRELGRLTAQYGPDDLGQAAEAGHLSIPKHVWRQVYDLCAPFRESF